MKRLVWLSLPAVAALAAAGIAYSSSNSGARNQDRVYGGGRICVVPDCSNVRDFSVDVHATPAGHTIVGDFATSRGMNPVNSADVTCATVHGNKAVIGGFVRSPGSNVDGLPFVMYFTDSGPPSNPIDDQATVPFFLGPTDTFAGQPADFPESCPASVDSFDSSLYRDVMTGDIRVVDAHD